ncbi:hypothetical protein BH10ACT7_BH10ACT7_20790 [soil metagenome]
MTALSVIAIAVLLVLVFAALALTVLASRGVTIGARKPIAFEVDEAGSIRLQTDVRTTLPGRFGLLHDAARGYVRVGPILRKGPRHTFRRIEAETGTPLPRRGTALWIRDVFRSPADLGLPFEEVSIDTSAGVCPAWVIPPIPVGTDSGVWVVHLHGIRSTRSVVLPGVAALKDLPVTSLVPSWRGDSEGPATSGGGSSLGWMEWRDVERALEFASTQGARTIILIGWSMGGTIARLLMRSSRFADDVAGLALVAPVTSWRAVVANAVRTARLPAATAAGVEFVLGNRVLCRLAGLVEPVRLADLEWGVDGDRAVPTLVIHNPGDDLVPHALIADFVRQKQAELVVFEASLHATEWNGSPARFESELRGWVRRQIVPSDHRKH